MRPAGRGELESLYFSYPAFSAPPREGLERRSPVVIVGAGPVGLVAALALARYGVRSIVVEKKSTFNDGSRAICISRSSFQIFDRLGIAAPFLNKALGWTTGRSYFRGRQFLEFQMPHDAQEKFLPMYNLQQQYIEKFLHDAAVRTGLIDIRWCSEAKDVRDVDGGVEIDVADFLGSYTLRADWLLAADGARSAVRAMRGLRLKGENFEGRYIIVDVRMAHDFPTIRRALFDPACLPGGTVLIHRQPDDIWRIDYQLKPEESSEEATRESAVREKVAAILEEIGHKGEWDLEWWSAYSANTLALDDYRDGRTFFIGDSAHIVPIFGVRGLNNGLADAENAAWKLARVIKGEAGATLLDSYSPERRGATLDVFANAIKSTRFMTPPTRGFALLRDAALSLSLTKSFAAAFANPRQMTPYTYADGPLTAPDESGFVGGPRPGAVAPDLRALNGERLSDLNPRGFLGLSFDVAAPDFGPFLETDRDFTMIRVFGDGVRGEDRDLLLARYAAAPGDFYLIRPDMHVAGRWRKDALEKGAAFLRRLLAIEELPNAIQRS